MIPGMNKRAMKQAMKRLGIQQQDIEASEVIIKTPEKNIIIENPQVAKVNMMGQQTFQVVGNIREEAISAEPEINEEDIKTVMEQTGVDEDKAKSAIKKTQGDLAAAIMELKSS